MRACLESPDVLRSNETSAGVPLPDFLPGSLTMEPGAARDYFALEHFHYLPKRPCSWASVWRVVYRDAPPRPDVNVSPRRGRPPCLPFPVARPARAGTGACPYVGRVRDRTGAGTGVRADTTPDDARVVAVGVLSYPVLSCAARERALGLARLSRAERVRFANAHVRSISRVVVHPQFRSLGLAVALVRRLIATCPTRYVEALAAMGHAHPFFERAGMTPAAPGEAAAGAAPVYYWFDRSSHLPKGE